ncbi:MAG: hypothetical protein ACR2RL_17225, partial [Gammaproteobacteria bacterium]
MQRPRTGNTGIRSALRICFASAPNITPVDHCPFFILATHSNAIAPENDMYAPQCRNGAVTSFIMNNHQEKKLMNEFDSELNQVAIFLAYLILGCLFVMYQTLPAA